MLVFTTANIAFLAVPKTATTAFETAFGPHADIVFKRGRKHVTAQRFRNRVAPFLNKTWDLEPEVIAVMREPVDQIGSWYRYRARQGILDPKKSTHGTSFDHFVLASLYRKPPRFAKVGAQFAFLSDARGRLAVHHLFSYECLPQAVDFMEHKIGKRVGQLPRENVSPQIDTVLSSKVRGVFERRRAADFALYDLLQRSGGYLGPAALTAFRPADNHKPVKLPTFLMADAPKIA